VGSRSAFDERQLKVVDMAGARAIDLVTDHYRIAPREWLGIPCEIKTLRALDPDEVIDTALAQTVCYAYKREIGRQVINEGDLYRICLQDHSILRTAGKTGANLERLLTYVLTHEFVHVVRFGCRLQRIDIPVNMRIAEEELVENTTRTILSKNGIARSFDLTRPD
jgi:hypothetical protein